MVSDITYTYIPTDEGWLYLAGIKNLFNGELVGYAKIVGCNLPWLVLKQGKSPVLLVFAAVSLALFAWLLTLHPNAAGRTYAAYGGMSIVVDNKKNVMYGSTQLRLQLQVIIYK